eukprot:scaffold9.g3164.t1
MHMSGAPVRRPPPPAAAPGDGEELDLVESLVARVFGRAVLEDRAPAGMKRLSDDALKELYPAPTDEWAEPLAGDAPEVALLRPLLARTQLEAAHLRLAYDAGAHGWSAAAFHARVDGFGAALVVAETAGGAVVGGYNPRGWVGGAAQAVIRDTAEQGIFFGPDGLAIPLAPGAERAAKCKLGPYYARAPAGGKSLFGPGEGGRGGAQLASLRVYVAEGEGEQAVHRASCAGTPLRLSAYRCRPSAHRTLPINAASSGLRAAESTAHPWPPSEPTQGTAEPEGLYELSKKLDEATRALQDQRTRQSKLAPYLVAPPRRGILGSSRFAQRLRKEIVQAARDKTRRPVLIVGEPGLEKDRIAALIHHSCPQHKEPIVQVECERLDERASELFGSGKRKGLLAFLRPGDTLVLNNIHLAPPAVLPLLEREVARAETSCSSMDDGLADSILSYAGEQQDPRPRIIMTAETTPEDVASFAALSSVIKASGGLSRWLPLTTDPLGRSQAYFLRRFVVGRGLAPRALSLTQDAVRRLASYSYPNNVVELRGMVERAAAQAVGTGGEINEDPQEVFNINLLEMFPALRSFLLSDWWPERINFGFTSWAFLVLVCVLFFGPQDRWPGIFLVYPVLGRIWCAENSRKDGVSGILVWEEVTGAKLLKWPREQLDQFGPWFLFSLFAGILVWEEVWDLPHTAYLSSWLLVLITGGAMVCSYFFERRLWCRYLCPIGGMNGLFAKLSMTELRARQGVCSSECNTFHCYKGGPAHSALPPPPGRQQKAAAQPAGGAVAALAAAASPLPPQAQALGGAALAALKLNEGQETTGCPLYSHPAQLGQTDNKNCTLCMSCLKACPHRSVEFRVRLPGINLWTGHNANWPEAALMFMLLGAVYVHNMPGLLLQLGIDPALVVTDNGPHIAATLAVLALPGMLAAGAHAAGAALLAPVPEAVAAAAAGNGGADALARGSRGSGSGSGGSGGSGDWAPTTAKGAGFLELSYGYLPLVWAGTLAHYYDSLLEEAGKVLQVLAATAGMDGHWLPALVAHPAVAHAMQGTILLVGLAGSLVATRKIADRPFAQLAPDCAMTLLLWAELWYLILPPGTA